MLDLELFFREYEKTLRESFKRKASALESFKKSEADLRDYVDALSDIEKAKNQTKLYQYQGMSKALLSNLLEIDPKDFSSETKRIIDTTEALKGLEDDIAQTASEFTEIKKRWKTFLTTNKYIKESNCEKEIEKEIQNIEDLMTNVGLNDIPKLDAEISSFKEKVKTIIIFLDKLFDLHNKSYFIGTKAKKIKEIIKEFLDKEIKVVSCDRILEKTKEINTKIKSIPKEYEVKKTEILEINNLGKSDIPVYAVKILNDVINLTDLEITHPKYEKTGKYIYLENYPKEGIFTSQEAIKKIQISKKQELAVEEHKEVAKNYLIVLAIAIVLIGGFMMAGALSPLIGLTISTTFILIFTILFNKIPDTVGKLHDVKDLFYFDEVDFVFVKYGQSYLKKNEAEKQIKEYINKRLKEF